MAQTSFDGSQGRDLTEKPPCLSNWAVFEFLTNIDDAYYVIQLVVSIRVSYIAAIRYIDTTIYRASLLFFYTCFIYANKLSKSLHLKLFDYVSHMVHVFINFTNLSHAERLPHAVA